MLHCVTNRLSVLLEGPDSQSKTSVFIFIHLWQ